MHTSCARQTGAKAPLTRIGTPRRHRAVSENGTNSIDPRAPSHQKTGGCSRGPIPRELLVEEFAGQMSRSLDRGMLNRFALHFVGSFAVDQNAKALGAVGKEARFPRTHALARKR